MAARRKPVGPVPAAGGQHRARPFSLRWGTLRDLPLLERHRFLMWEAIGGRTHPELQAAGPPYARWLRTQLRKRRARAVLAVDEDGTPLGSGVLWYSECQPRPEWARGVIPYILSMYTEPSARRLGVATALVERMVAVCRKEGYPRVTLHASKFGRPVYKRLGFRASNEMRLDLVAPRVPVPALAGDPVVSSNPPKEGPMPSRAARGRASPGRTRSD